MPSDAAAVLGFAGACGFSLIVLGCQPSQHPPQIVAAAAPEARFIARLGGADQRLSSLVGGSSGPPPCMRAARFEGVAFAGGNEIRVWLVNSSIAVERHNDKQRDGLSLRVEVADRRHVLGYGRTIEYRLGPTVDSAGPSITTWQSRDTLRLLLPWTQTLSPRWLVFFVNYTAISYGGQTSECGTLLLSDTLRFSASDSS